MAHSIATRDARTPMHAKPVASLIADYALSQIKFIPEFNFVLGFLNDRLHVLAVQFNPSALMAEFLKDAVKPASRPVIRTGAAAVTVIRVLTMSAVTWWRLVGH